jgi:sulfoxide reductase heme-binding subunit YedZ
LEEIEIMSVDWLSTWNLIRTSGFLAYFLFTLSIAAGLMSRLSILQKQKLLMLELHKTSGWIGMLTTFFHAALLVVDAYVPYQVGEILLPFSAENSPVLSAFGTISLYFFLLTMATSDFFMKRLGRTLWKKIHLLVLPAWVLMVLHGILIGTDSAQSWAAFLYGGGVILILTLLVFRHLEGKLKSTTSKKVNYLRKTP